MDESPERVRPGRPGAERWLPSLSRGGVANAKAGISER